MVKNKLVALALLLEIILFQAPASMKGQELIDIPKPTHFEEGVPCARLVTIKEIKSDFDDDLFFARPWTIAVGKKYFYVYDAKLIKLFVFSNDFKYIGQFLESGQGPGEGLPGYPGNKAVYAAPDDKLYVHEAMADKIIQFSATGKYLKEIRLNRVRKTSLAFPPVTDKGGFFYAYSVNKGIVDRLDSRMNLVHTYLNMNENLRFVIYKPAYREFYKNSPGLNFWKMPNQTNTMYDITADGHLLIYLFHSSTVYLFKGDRRVGRFQVLIDRVLPVYRKRAEEAYIKQKKGKGGILHASLMFNGCFLDKDEPFFYLKFIEENKSITLYKFDLKGKLVEIIDNIRSGIQAKMNGLFYGLSSTSGYRHPAIFKKEGRK